jgi:hypothetical protein
MFSLLWGVIYIKVTGFVSSLHSGEAKGYLFHTEISGGIGI